MRVMTIGDMLEAAVKRFPRKVAVVGADSRLSYRELYAQAAAVARALALKGVAKGSRIGVLTEKTPEAISSLIGIMAMGGTAVPLNPKDSADALRQCLKLAAARHLVMADACQSLLPALTAAAPRRNVIRMDEHCEAGRRHCGKGAMPRADICAEDVAYLNFTSGSTSTPKAALVTHGNLFWNTVASVEALKLNAADVHLCLFPIYMHPHEIFLRPLYLGGAMVLVDGPSPRAIAAAIEQAGVTCMMAVASVYAALVRFRGSHPFRCPALRLAESGGMQVSPALADAFESSFGIPMTPVWGSTETTGIALACPVGTTPRLGAMGRPCPHYDVRLRDESGAQLGPGRIGEMAIRGPGVCQGYAWGHASAGMQFRAGWLWTGDMARFNEEGDFFFVERKSRMMKVRGRQVFPNEVEEVILSHPAVAEAAVIRTRDHSQEEIPKAIVVLKEGQDLAEQALRRYCAVKLPRYKVPRRFAFTNALPRTSGGKIIYARLDADERSHADPDTCGAGGA